MIFFATRTHRMSKCTNLRLDGRSKRRNGVVARRFRPLGKNSNRFFFVLFFFDTQPEIRLISGEILKICFRFARLHSDAFRRANGTNSCAEPQRTRWNPFDDEKMRASAREEKKIGNAIKRLTSLFPLSFLEIA